MAKFKVVAEIFVNGASVKKKADAITALLEMLDAYDEMKETSSEITISPLKIEKEK